VTTKSSAQRILSLIDLTNLNDDCTEEDVVELCSRAQGEFGNTAAVCVWPRFVNLCASILRGTSIKVATVVNFPHGGTDVADVVATTIAALDAGADEIDLVLPYQSMITGDEAQVLSILQAVREVVHAPSHLKVILETGELINPERIRRASELAIKSGADFIKTSTGKTKISATPEAVTTMLQVIRDSGRPVGLKPSGGIRTVADAQQYLDLADAIMGPQWATPQTFRFGASGLLDAVEAELRS
jgi:deoxyribose-phosphate aldolase